jgi:transcriptional regulator with GAF, ATPase, and Fis domain
MLGKHLRAIVDGSGGLVGRALSLRDAPARRRLLIIVAALSVWLYALSVAWYVLTLPDVGLRCAFSTKVSRVDPGYLIEQPGVAAPDLREHAVVRMGGQSIESWPQMLNVMQELYEQPAQPEGSQASATHVHVDGEQQVLVELERPDGADHIKVWCRLQKPSPETLVPSVLWFCLTSGLFIVAAIVYWNRPEDRSARQFFWLSIAAFGAYMGGYHWSRIATQPTLIVVFIVCAVMGRAVSLHFYLLFPRPKEVLRRQPVWSLLVVYGVPSVFLLLLLYDYSNMRLLFHGHSQTRQIAVQLEALQGRMVQNIYLYFDVAAVWYLLSLAALAHSYWSAIDPTERNQVKWILYGVCASLVPIGYSLYLAVKQPIEFGGGAATWPMFGASVCVTLAYTISITRYRLMQLDQIITAGAIYFLISLLAGLCYWAVVFVGTLLFSWWNPASLSQAIGVSTAALVLLIVLDWLRGRVKRALDRRLYREKTKLDRTLRRMSHAIDQLIDPQVLAHRLLQASAELLGVARGAVYLREGNPPLFRLADALGPAPSQPELAPDAPLALTLKTQDTVVAWPTLGFGADPAKRQLHFLGGQVAQALVHEGQLLALLILGPKERGTYQTEDLNQLAAFAQITALALESAQGHRKIEALNHDLKDKVEKISEQQRRIVALQGQLTRQALRERTPAARPALPANGAGHGSTVPAPQLGGIVGSSEVMRRLSREVQKVSASQSAVLLRGESGTGKELLARALHEHSPRAGKAFVKVHCAALSPGLLESELFGHVKGAFTGAHRDKVGRFELANGGTLFLDEIGDISLDVQTKLLRVLQEKTIERVGSSDSLQVDVRIIAATHQNLEQLIAAGRFRDDLYYRLNVISIAVPSLRERREDIPELVMHFLRVFGQRSGKTVSQVDDDALAQLKAHSWPGNIRQLENVLERAVVLAEGPTVSLHDLPPEIQQHAGDLGLASKADWAGDDPAVFDAGGIDIDRAEWERRERERMLRALAGAHGNKAEAARALGLARSTLLSRMRKLGIG